MKILHVVRQFFPSTGGTETLVYQLCKNLQMLGHEVKVITLSRLFSMPDKILPRHEIFKGIPVERINFRGSRRYPLAPSVLVKLKGFDIIHIHCIDFFSDFLALSKIWHKKKIVVNTNGLFFHTNDYKVLKNIFLRTVVRFSQLFWDHTICISQNDYKIAKIAVSTSKLSIIEPGIDLPLFSKQQKNFRTLLKKRQILFIGRLQRHKRVDQLIRLLHLLPDKKVKLIIAGPDWENLWPEFQSLSFQLGLKDRVVYKGEISEEAKINLLMESMVLGSASEYEGFGITVVEALACGTPVLLNKIPTFQEITDPVSKALAFLFNFSELEKHLPQIVSFLDALPNSSSPELFPIASDYSWEKKAREVQKIYASVI